jgi:transposase-like protein
MISLTMLLDDTKCYETVRGLRWHEGEACPECKSLHISKQGRDTTQPARRKYACKDCGRHFDDLTGTIFAGRHQPLVAWIGCLYLMGLNLSNCQIAQELDLNEDDVHRMATQLRTGIIASEPTPVLSGEVECDEVYVVAGHKGNPDAVQKKGRKARCRRLKGAPGRGTLEKEKPPIFGMIERGGQVVLRMLENVQQRTIRPLIQAIIPPGTQIYTDEYDIYARLPEWGYGHKTVCHSRGEYARDEDGDGFHEVHVNTMEGFWSLLRSWLRPHRGISQERLPLYLGFFQFVHNVRRRGRGLLLPMLSALLVGAV